MMSVKRNLITNWVRVTHKIINNKNLSSNAKVVHMAIMSNSDNWDLHLTEIYKRIGISNDSGARAVKQLMNANLFIKYRTKDEKGKLSDWVYFISDDPMTEEEKEIAIKELITLIKKNKND